MAELRPIASSERIAILDVLRGFALAGVLIANTASFTGRHFLAGGPESLGLADTIAAIFVEVFVSSKSMTLLSCLFGFGFAVTLLRAEARGASGVPLFVRRLAVLFAIGCCHIALLWWGDVTWAYAVCGTALLAFRRSSDRALLAWACALIFVPPLVMALPGVSGTLRSALPHASREFYAELAAAIRGTDRVALMWAQIQHVYYFAAALPLTIFPWVIGRFLAGYWAGKHRIFDDDGAARLALFRRLLGWGTVAGLGATAIMFVYGNAFRGYELLLPGKLAIIAVQELSVLGMVAAYVGLVVVLMRRARWRRWLLVLAPVGRMPLTTYLCQSLVATAIYYGWGLGYGTSQGQARELGISCAIFAGQIAAAHMWLRHFRFGPAEWVWRSLVYRQAQPMRRAPSR